MKKLSTFLVLSMYFLNVFPQACVPDGQYAGISGWYPDSTTGIPEGYDLSNYSTVITMVVPTDSTNGWGLWTVNYVSIDSVKIITTDTVNLSYIGFFYACYPSDNHVSGGSSGCINIYGVPNLSAVYPIVIYVTYNVTSLTYGNWNLK